MNRRLLKHKDCIQDLEYLGHYLYGQCEIYTGNKHIVFLGLSKFKPEALNFNVLLDSNAGFEKDSHVYLKRLF